MTEKAFDYTKPLVNFYLERLDLAKEAELFDFSFAPHTPMSSTVRVARIRLPFEGRSFMWFMGSVGQIGSSIYHEGMHAHQFIGTFDSDSMAICELIAAAYHYDNFISRLDYGHTIPVGELSPLRQSGYVAALILHPELYRPFENAEIGILGIKMHFYSLIPITQRELDIKKKRGLDVLLNSWEMQKKDIIHINIPESL